MKIASLEFDIVRPRLWDLVAIAVMLIGALIAAVSMGRALTGAATAQFSDTATRGLGLVQLAVCLGSLLILGKTATNGTIWGNLAAVAGIFVGMSGVLLSAVLWAAA